MTIEKSPITSARFSRRRALAGATVGAVGLAAGSRLSEILTARSAPAFLQGGNTLTYWGVITFSQKTDDFQVETIKQWGEENGFDVDVVMVNGNEMNMKMSAAVESGTLPDAADMSVDIALLLSTTGQLAPLDDVYERIGEAHGGWLDSAARATDPSLFGGIRAGIPYGTIGNLLFRRQDLLTEAGITDAPQTWQDVKDAAEATTKPPVFGFGFAISNVGDANIHAQMLQSWGGRIADDTGTECTLKSDQTKEFLEWVADAYAKGLYPPGVATWDGAGDNNAYQSGQVVFIANTGSVYVWMKDNDEELANATAYSALPAGPVMRVSPAGVNVRVVPERGRNKDAAKALIEHLASKEFMAEYFSDGVFGPVLNEQLSYDVFSSNPVHAGLKDLALNGTPPAYPDVSNTAYADFMANFVVPRMIQRVVIDGMSIDDAIDEAQEQGDAIYAKYR